jgi:pyridine nucleotide-disulfide oxidoreductase family protein
MRRLVLAGAGHAHALVLLDWARAPLPGVELVVVSPQALAPYSGMVPGWLAGHYRFDEIVIDVPALAAAAGARWVPAEIARLDPAGRTLHLDDGSALGYDLLSLNIGSTLRPPPALAADARRTVLALRPLARLRQQVQALLVRWQAEAGHAPWRVTAVGGGAAGFEALLALQARLRALRPDRAVQARLLGRGGQLLPGISPPARRAAARALARAGVAVELGRGWVPGDDAPADAAHELVLWATGAEAHDWQRDPARRGTLAVDGGGFVRIGAALRSTSHPEIFAAGDCAHWDGPGDSVGGMASDSAASDATAAGLPKAGVYAVRMGPVLARNLRAALGDGTAADYQSQHHFLALLATGDGRAIATRGALGASGAWAWWWKDRIDRGFIGRFPRGAAVADAAREATTPKSPAR